jgi:tRNA threonylcarbamoyl adenosine modification protein YeaZ
VGSAATGTGGQSIARSGLDSRAMSAARAVLAFDFASPVASVAVARAGELLAGATAPRADGGPELLALVARAVVEAGLAPPDLGGVVALRGPGSFTGLRVACATALGLAAAHATPATAVSTLEALALAAPAGAGTVLAVVDALRGEWFVQRWRRGAGIEAEPAEEPRLARITEPGLLTGVDLVSGQEAPRFLAAARADAAAPDPTPPSLEAFRLCDAVARAASLDRWPWNEALLSHPLYLRPPAVTVPRSS